jgi:phosphatidylinositol glycan class B
MQLKVKSNYLLVAVFLYLIASFLHVGYVHADEYYQVFQFAAAKIGLYVLRTPWEHTEAMRSTLMPSIIVVIYRIYALFTTTPDPFIIGFIMRVIASIISLSSIVIMLQVFLPGIKNEKYKKYLTLLAFFTLAGMYYNIHFCSENISGSLFLIAFSLIFAKLRSSVLKYFLVGLFLGLAFTVRFQTGFLILGIVLWLMFIERLHIRYLFVLFFSLIITILLFNILLDHWYYDNWTISAWNYFKQNIVLDKVNGYGIESPFYYIYMTASILPFGPLYVIACIILFVYKPRHPLTWILLPFIIGHSMIGHKEIRFMVPIINFMPLCLIYAFEIIQDKFGFDVLSWRKTIKILWWVNCLSLVVMAIPPTTELPVSHYIYDNYTNPTDYSFLTYGGSDVDFYKRQNLISHKINKVEDLVCNPGRTCLLALTCSQAEELQFPFQDKVIYTQCPSWIFNLNVGNWINRTAIYTVYHLN